MRKNRNTKYLALCSVICFLLFTQCSKQDGQAGLSPALNQAFFLAEQNSINRLNIDWEALRETVRKAEFNLGYEGGFRSLLRNLADNHSFLITASGSFISESQRPCSGDRYDFSGLPDDIGYIQVNGFSGSQAQALSLVNSIQSRIREQDGPNLKGWVVDLSTNTGGNMYPMIAGLGPFFDQETLGYFIDPVALEEDWSYREGTSYLGDFPIVGTDSPYSLLNPNAKVVVVLNGRTASSGEATAISFIGRPNTLFLGRSTCGLSTANQTFELSNGDRFVLTVSTMADRNKQPYGEEIIPDEVTNTSTELKARIIEWLDG